MTAAGESDAPAALPSFTTTADPAAAPASFVIANVVFSAQTATSVKLTLTAANADDRVNEYSV